MSNKQIVIASPFLIIAVNFAIAYFVGPYVGKWVFIPMILMGWVLWSYFILKYKSQNDFSKWLNKPKGSIVWSFLAVFIGLIPLPLFIFNYHVLNHWTIILPWALLFIINPWIEEFYWRGLLLDYTKSWKPALAIFYSSILFSANHAAFGLYSEMNSSYGVVISTLLMGLIWALVYYKTKSLRWAIFAHILVDFFNLSSAAFLDLWDKGTWG